LVQKASRHSDPSFNLYHIENYCSDEKRQQWQVLVASFLTMAVQTLVRPEESQESSVLALTAAVVGEFADFVEMRGAAPSPAASPLASSLRIGTARAVSISLCTTLRVLCVGTPEKQEEGGGVEERKEGEKERKEGGVAPAEEAKSLLAVDIARILRFALADAGAGARPGGADALAAGRAAHKVRIHVKIDLHSLAPHSHCRLH
jgi:hypothetical protein